MYERFYRLRERPFALTPDPDYLYPSRVHSEALSYLRYGIESQAGFVVITGAIGSGKTTLLQTLLRGLDHHITVARVMNTMLDPRELLEAALIDLGLDPSGKSKPALLRDFGEFLANERAAGRLVLLVIDEAQNLSLPALEEIRMLSNLETEKSKLVQIVLIGQPELRDKLNRRELEQLRQRITVSYHLLPLDADETARYVNHRLARASIGAPLEFPRAATDSIHDRSGGVPRLINVIADATLVYGYGEERCEIDDALVMAVVADLDDTGVLGPSAFAPPEHHGASARPPVAPTFAPPDQDGASAGASARQVAEGIALADKQRVQAEAISLAKTRRELAELERQLQHREHEMASRERELAEQRKVLADQYRIQPSAWPPLESAPLQSGTASVKVRLKPDTTATPRSKPSVTYRPHPTLVGGLWRRMKHTLLGAEPVLEDSL